MQCLKHKASALGNAWVWEHGFTNHLGMPAQVQPLLQLQSRQTDSKSSVYTAQTESTWTSSYQRLGKVQQSQRPLEASTIHWAQQTWGGTGQVCKEPEELMPRCHPPALSWMAGAAVQVLLQLAAVGSARAACPDRLLSAEHSLRAMGLGCSCRRAKRRAGGKAKHGKGRGKSGRENTKWAVTVYSA